MIPNTMNVIKPVTITDAMFSSSTVAENDFAAWSAATAYVIGNKVIRAATHRIYERLTNGTTATAPESDTTNWLDIGPTNRWAMFDDVVGTQTTTTTSFTAVLLPGSIEGLGLLELVGKSLVVTMKDAPAGTVIYQSTTDIDDTPIESVYDWFFTDFVQKSEVVLLDLPVHFEGCELTISMSTDTGNEVSCGVCKFGRILPIGSTKYGASIGIIDYSKKQVDDFGRYSIIKREFAKKATVQVTIERSRFNRIIKELSELRATMAIWVITQDPQLSQTYICGFYKDFSIEISYPTAALCSIDIEGLI